MPVSNTWRDLHLWDLFILFTKLEHFSVVFFAQALISKISNYEASGFVVERSTKSLEITGSNPASDLQQKKTALLRLVWLNTVHVKTKIFKYFNNAIFYCWWSVAQFESAISRLLVERSATKLPMTGLISIIGIKLIKLWICQAHFQARTWLIKLIGSGLAPSSQNIGSYLRTPCCVYFKNILTIVSDDRKWCLYYKCASP